MFVRTYFDNYCCPIVKNANIKHFYHYMLPEIDLKQNIKICKKMEGLETNQLFSCTQLFFVMWSGNPTTSALNLVFPLSHPLL